MKWFLSTLIQFVVKRPLSSDSFVYLPLNQRFGSSPQRWSNHGVPSFRETSLHQMEHELLGQRSVEDVQRSTSRRRRPSSTNSLLRGLSHETGRPLWGWTGRAKGGFLDWFLRFCDSSTSSWFPPLPAIPFPLAYFPSSLNVLHLAVGTLRKMSIVLPCFCCSLRTTIRNKCNETADIPSSFMSHDSLEWIDLKRFIRRKLLG